jgi:transposase
MIPRQEGTRLPNDLSLYIGKKTLVKFILEAIEEMNLPPVNTENSEPADKPLAPVTMLTLLTYCYATGVYSATDIELGIQSDQMIQYLCARNCPDIFEIGLFRRYNRARITQCLIAVLRRVWELRFCGEDAEPIRGAACFGSLPAWWTDPNLPPDFQREAERRIARAVRADSMALDV